MDCVGIVVLAPCPLFLDCEPNVIFTRAVRDFADIVVVANEIRMLLVSLANFLRAESYRYGLRENVTELMDYPLCGIALMP